MTAAVLRGIATGECVYRLGDDPDGLYVVLEGEVHLIAYPVAGNQIVSLRLRSGD